MKADSGFLTLSEIENASSGNETRVILYHFYHRIGVGEKKENIIIRKPKMASVRFAAETLDRAGDNILTRNNI